MTIKELRDQLNYLCTTGYGNKTVALANDEEWNGIHFLTGSIVYEKDVLNEIESYGMVPFGMNINDVIVVG